ncbi:hypothetical protein HN997_01440 [archaeon]|jgi:hypothetical protein|nr:hypothetical protein [archaeon]MBT5343037.1 hypothetical protein [Candidatus Woesearchaeota archaeon]MBT6402255.1 hypothetical protein [Candidatus Woesearchaeota archaeon]MBT6773944.1 hypothetical protein [Candidatus Woesearchaeota archaeon]MBT6955937.1 hypothetical protein [archaeon]
MGNELTLEWLGTGSAMNYELGNSNFTLSRGDSKVVVDLSANNANMLVARNFELGSLVNLIATHDHGDHIDGLEGVGFLGWNALGREDTERPTLYVASQKLLGAVKSTLYQKMKDQQHPDNAPFQADFDFYFNTVIGEEIKIPGLPAIYLHPTLHVQDMECYGVHIPEYGLWISGDTRQVKELPEGTALAFRDAGGPGNEARVHSDLDLDLIDRSADEKAITFLYHMGGTWRDSNQKQHGFAGMAMPGDKFILDGKDYRLDTTETFIHQRVPYSGPRE